MKLETAIRAAGAAARLTRLVALDSLLDVPRSKVEIWANTRKHGENYSAEQAENDPHPIAKLITCTWCSGFWVSAAVAASAHAFGDRRMWKVAADAFGLSFLASVLVNRTND
ncbi:DUF1360 domain-containing protein [Amycolatopsis sp. DSM 110486]|uniref:DUF1360 domain-containing protein n=1 Tax=Amycolatopsis sp. DSM 110486 TaxID=2865832 RepID=UPI001C6A0C9B|nr:DUF1360 domain-containing protein [Amycolatopsis sp. DSM 110486]QYN17596.1 DUF1360 domain-containing protein [Amycolatopsis sp. DSM 110486]